MDARARRSGLVVLGISVFHGLSLVLHAGAAVSVLMLLPRGFPLSHPRSFANVLVPCLVLCASLGTGVLLRARPRAATSSLAAYPAAWLGFALSTTLCFPVSGGLVARFAGAGALFLALGWVVWFRSFRPANALVLSLTALTGSVVGLVLPRTQRSPAPSTRPAPFAMTAPPPGTAMSPAEVSVALTPNLRVQQEQGQVEMQLGKLRMVVDPFLEFQSRSPDGFWTVFSEQRPQQRLLAHSTLHGSVLDLAYEPAHQLRVEALATGALNIDATTFVERDVYSHLNSFTTLLLSGHQRLGLRFSACPGATIEITHADYPVGAPASFAYLDENGTFRVVRAASAEKGPYTTLASGSLGRGASLGITFVELSATLARALGELEFADWARELSTELSPTAGFGVPQNAIQFGLASTEAASQAYIVLSLASTGVGRGWDSVGHRAGHYRNRMAWRPSEENR
jgi:hypothetical protein